MSARRPLLTALGATTLLGALWFVPSANATAPEGATTGTTAVRSASAPLGGAPVPAGAPANANDGATTAEEGGGVRPQLVLADTGGVDTTPYVFGGIACLGVGAGFVVFSASRGRAH
ncbi:hypothetical protein [Streptomyces sp. NPDC012888]|uniref:hypothetical protein n=1 Tax=Streptomyces sp. NPDC012888 TaxID=3364855 RepID=UPI003698D5FB